MIREKRNLGFTLVEIMFGISLFVLALFPLLSVLGQSLSFGTYANNRAIAMNEARRVMEDVRRVADTSGLASVASLSYTGTALPGEAISITDLSGNPLTNNANPLPLQVTVNWTEKSRTVQYRVVTMVTER